MLYINNGDIMFNLFGRRTAKDFVAEAKETYSVPEVAPVDVPKKEKREFYRVGRTEDGCTTLTMIDSGGYGSLTLTMNREACEQMIRMLEATFDVETTDAQSS
jgi:hypothetical protein